MQNRQIKFRIWIPIRKEFDHVSMSELIYEDGHYYTWRGIDKGFPVMQYTGLKDKNGKEIYEMDIVKVDWGNMAEEYITMNGYDKPFVMEFSNYEYAPFSRCLPTPDMVEIIGNIYENPSLLVTEPKG